MYNLKDYIYKFNEDTPYSIDPPNHYVSTKLDAEKIILNFSSNNKSNLKTMIIRPGSGVIGQYDKNLRM